MLLINLFGGPGVGKSTIAAYLYSRFSMDSYRAELVGEAAKEVVWDESTAFFRNQVLITGQQYQRIIRLIGKVDIAISDSPLILGSVYGRDLPYSEALTGLIHTLNNTTRDLHQLNIVLLRSGNRIYNPEGRNQKTLEEAAAFDRLIEALANPVFMKIVSDGDGADRLYRQLLPTVDAMRIQPLTERRERPRTNSTMRKIEDITYSVLREHEKQPAEPHARCAECGTPLEDGTKCEHC